MERHRRENVPALGRRVGAGMRAGEHARSTGLVAKPSRWRSIRIALATALLLWAWVAAATSYVYDPNGRLVVVKNDAGESARYVYDPMGNLLRIDRIAANALAVFGFAPGRGSPGASVRISGQGFSPTAAQNSVKFNGVAATVSAASASELTATVPAGATTGPISVAVGAASASSVSDFVVDVDAQPPVITAVSPLVAEIGTAVTVDGQHLLPVAEQTSVRLGGRSTQPSERTDTRIAFPVPATAGSGKVSVTTPYGTATSTDDVLVLPPGFSASDIELRKRLGVDAPAQGFSIAGAGKSAAVLFDSAGGEFLSAQFSVISVGSLSYTLYGVDNKRLAGGTVSPASPSFHLPKLAAAGTYLLLLRPASAPATWNLAIERAAALPLDGASLALDTTIAAQSKRVIFSAPSGADLGFGLSDHATPSAWSSASVYAYGPDGAQIGYQSCEQSKNGCSLNFSGALAGVYSLVIQPAQSGAQTLGFDVSLSSDATATLTRDVAATLNLVRRGQNGRLSFTGTAGDVVGLLVAGQQTVPAGRTAYYRVHKPDGTLWKSTAIATGATMNLALPTTGSYQVFVDPEYGETLTAQVLLSSGTLARPALDGASSSFATTQPGQGVYLAIDASAGQNLGLGLSELTVASGTGVSVNAYRPDGSLQANAVCYAVNDGCDLNLSNLVAGRYAVEIVPAADQTMAFKATLSSDATGALVRDVASVQTIARRGQNARLSFPGVVGDTVALRIAAQSTTPAASGAYYRIYKPDGSSLGATYASGDKTLNVELPLSGDYQIMVDPEYGATVSAELKIIAGTIGVMELDGSSGKHETQAGQEVVLTFGAQEGKHLGLGISDLTVTSGSYVRVYAYRPNGTTLLDDHWCRIENSGCGINFFNPVSGTYTVKVKPSSASQTMKFRSTLSSAAGGTLTRDMPITLNLDRRGQDGFFTFTGTSGEMLALQVAGQSTAPAGRKVVYRVYEPNDRSIPEWSVEPSAGGFISMRLPANGTYWVYADPEVGAAATAQLTLSTGTARSLVADGASDSVATTLPGQTIHYRVNAAAGQNLGFGMSELGVSTGSYVRVFAYRPDGNKLVDDRWCRVEEGGCDVNIFNAAAGVYSILILPSRDDQAMQFKATLSSAQTGALGRDTPLSLNLGRRGQDGLMTFSGIAGETLALQIAGQAALPAGKVVYRVYEPNDRSLSEWSLDSSTGGFINMRLPRTGTYWVYADPLVGSTATAQVTLSTGTTSEMVRDGASAAIETGQPGQTAHFRFEAAAGENLGFGLSDLVLSSGSYVRVFAFRPDGSKLVDDRWCYAANGGCDISVYNAMAGSYSILVLPSGDDQAMQFKATLSSARTAALNRDAPMTLDLNRRGRDGFLTFSGTAGEVLTLQIAAQTTLPAGNKVAYRVYEPNDRSLPDWSLEPTAGGFINMRLPRTGTYWVYVDPLVGATAVTQITLSTGTTSGLVLDGPSLNAATTLPGQSVHYRYDASAGQNIGFGLSDLVANTGSYVRVFAFRPDGSKLVDDRWCYISEGGCDVSIYNAMAGTYSILVLPRSDEQTMQFKATLSSAYAAVLARDTPTTLNLNRRGRDALLTFAGTVGETLALRVAGQSTAPTGYRVVYRVYEPNDRVFQDWTLQPTVAESANMTLPRTGTYWIYVDPALGATAEAQITLDSTP